MSWPRRTRGTFGARAATAIDAMLVGDSLSRHPIWKWLYRPNGSSIAIRFQRLEDV